MNSPVSVLVVAGSTRTESFNKKLARLAAARLSDRGVSSTFIDLRDFPLPLFDEDLEAQHGMPANAKALKALMKAHQGFLLSSPEYNSSISAVLKNTIDWASRKEAGEKPLECFSGKVAGLVSASPGELGGLRGLAVVRMLLGNIGMVVVPEQFALARAHEAFDELGGIKDPAKRALLDKVVDRTADVVLTLHGAAR